MKLLVQAGFVRAQKRGRWVYYDLEPDAFAAVAGQLGRYSRAAKVAGA